MTLAEAAKEYGENERIKKILKKTKSYADHTMVSGTKPDWVSGIQETLGNVVEFPSHMVDNLYQNIKAHFGEQPPLPKGFAKFAHRSAVLTNDSYKDHGERSHFENWNHLKHFSNDRISVHEQPHTGNWHVAIRGTDITKPEDTWYNVLNMAGIMPEEERTTHKHIRRLARIHKIQHPGADFELSGHSQGGKWANDILDVSSANPFAEYVTRSMSHESGPTIGSKHTHHSKHHKIHKKWDFVSAMDNPGTGAHNHLMQFAAGGTYHSTIIDPHVWGEYVSANEAGYEMAPQESGIKEEL